MRGSLALAFTRGSSNAQLAEVPSVQMETRVISTSYAA